MDADSDKRRMNGVQRVVVKIGSAVIAEHGQLQPRVVAELVRDVAAVRRQGCDVVMVCSGAIAAGYAPLGFGAPPRAVVERQAAASVGQPRLMAVLARAFARHKLAVAQLLMTSPDIESRRRFLSARHTMAMLLERGVIPIINENDALSDDQSMVGDNDHLAAMVTSVVSAELLIMLSRVDGLREDGGGGPLIPRVEVGSAVDEHVGEALSATGVGGMEAKVRAARLASTWGVTTVIASGKQAGLLPRIVAGEPIGTLFMPRAHGLSSRKRWIAFRARSRGTIRVDDGARRAIIERGASLLPSGIVHVEGRFEMGARVELADADGAAFAVGLVSYDSQQIGRLEGRRMSEIKSVLGFEYVKEIVHRDDLVLIGPPSREDEP